MADSIPARLRRFLLRSGVSQEEAAKRMGYSHASGLQRYLSETDYTKEYVSVQFAKKFAEAVTGRGPDPVTVDEVLELAGIIQPIKVGKVQHSLSPPPRNQRRIWMLCIPLEDLPAQQLLSRRLRLRAGT